MNTTKTAIPLAILLLLLINSTATNIITGNTTYTNTTDTWTPDGQGRTVTAQNFATINTPKFRVLSGEEATINTQIDNAISLKQSTIMIQTDQITIPQVYQKNGTTQTQTTNYTNGTQNQYEPTENIIPIKTIQIKYDGRTWTAFTTNHDQTYYYKPTVPDDGKVIKYSIILNQSDTYLELDPEVLGVHQSTYWWSFDQNLSSVGGGTPLTWTVSTGAIQYETDAKEGNGSINVTGDVLRITTFPTPITNFSYCGWANLSGSWAIFMDKRTTTNIMFYSELTVPAFYWVNSNFPNTIPTPKGGWFHYCLIGNASWNSTSGIGRDLLYVNGTLVGNVTAKNALANGATWYLTAFYDSTTVGRNIGRMDGLGFWTNYTLTAAEILGLYGNNMTNTTPTCTPNTTPTHDQNYNIICGYKYNCTTTIDLGTGILQVEKGQFTAEKGCHLYASGISVNKATGGYSIIDDGTASAAIKK